MAQMVKNPPVMWETWVRSRVGKIPWRGKWQPTPVFFPGESHGWKSLEGYSPRGHKEADMTEQLGRHSQGEASGIWSQKGNVGTEKHL